jgi:hypothetical protein
MRCGKIRKLTTAEEKLYQRSLTIGDSLDYDRSILPNLHLIIYLLLLGIVIAKYIEYQPITKV